MDVVQAPSPLKRIRAASRYFVAAAALLVFIGWFLNTPPGLSGKADAIGYAVCHRISERSFHIGTLQLPLCARCSGMYLGAMVGLAYLAICGGKRIQMPHWTVFIPLGLFVAAFGVDGVNSYLYLIKQVYPGALAQIPNLYIPNNTLRLLTGSGMGLGIAAFLFPAFNSTVWADADEHRALPNLRSFGLLTGIMLILDLLVLTENPVALYPLALISTLGVLVLLTMVYSMLWVMVMGQENKFSRLRELWLPLVAGLTIAMIQIAAIDMLRLGLTGTWGAFPLGR